MKDIQETEGNSPLPRSESLAEVNFPTVAALLTAG